MCAFRLGAKDDDLSDRAWGEPGRRGGITRSDRCGRPGENRGMRGEQLPLPGPPTARPCPVDNSGTRSIRVARNLLRSINAMRYPVARRATDRDDRPSRLGGQAVEPAGTDAVIPRIVRHRGGARRLRPRHRASAGRCARRDVRRRRRGGRGVRAPGRRLERRGPFRRAARRDRAARTGRHHRGRRGGAGARARDRGGARLGGGEPRRAQAGGGRTLPGARGA